MSKVFAESETENNMVMPDLSMEMTLLIVKRCVKEIRERGKFNQFPFFLLIVSVCYSCHDRKKGTIVNTTCMMSCMQLWSN